MHKLLALASLGTALLLAPRSSHAVVPPRLPVHALAPLETVDQGLLLADGRRIAPTSPPQLARANRALSPAQRHSQQTLATWFGPNVNVIWHDERPVPVRIWGAGATTPGVVNDPALAVRTAQGLLRDSVTALAPGVAAGDFALVTNVLTQGQRTVAFAQYADGARVVGASIFFTFVHDRLVQAGSTAHLAVAQLRTASPNADATGGPVAIAPTAQWLRSASQLAPHEALDVVTAPERVWLPVHQRSASGVAYLLADHVVMRSPRAAWDVWLMPNGNAPLARQARVTTASGTIAYEIPTRAPRFGLTPTPVPFADFLLQQGAAQSTQAGRLQWGSDTTLLPSVTGPFVSVINQAPATPAWPRTPLQSDGTTVVRTSHIEQLAQLNAFVWANAAKQRARRIAPDLAFHDQTLAVYVNEASACNAYSTGDDIHFFSASDDCENTGLLADVVEHEYGHSMHRHALIPGVGEFDSTVSEALADYLAITTTEDPVLGRGFFHNHPEIAVRDLDPVYREKVFPDDLVNEVHADGEILVGALWDMRKALIVKLGAATGAARADQIFYRIMQRTTGLATTYADALLGDDDNGDLADGTPNRCQIEAAFGHHGLTPNRLPLPVLAPPKRDGFTITLHDDGAAPAPTGCPKPSIIGGELHWQIRGTETRGTVPLTVDAGQIRAEIPEAPEGSEVRYRVRVEWSDGAHVQFPQTAQDPDYQFYVGDVTTLWCADFEAPVAGLTLTGDWEVGRLAGNNFSGDPSTAFAGEGVLGTRLGGNGLYSQNKISKAVLPSIATAGWGEVRLRFMRWLHVEGAESDQATISNGEHVLWTNPARTVTTELEQLIMPPQRLRDASWVPVDLSLGAGSALETSNIELRLISDRGGELGGWTIDELCVVAAAPTCGDGIAVGSEACDDGNATTGDGCTPTCTLEPDTSGCCSSSPEPLGSGLLALGLGLGLGFGRRRTRWAPHG